MRFPVVNRRLVGLLLLAPLPPLLAVGCAPAFDPGSLILAPRVVAVVADPPEATPGAAVNLTPTVASPTGTLEAGVGYDATWWRCPDSDSDALGDFSQCTVPSARIDLGTEVPYADVVPADLFGELPAPGAEPAEDTTPPEKVLGALLGYWRVVGITTEADNQRIRSFKRVPVYLPVPLGTLDERLTDLDVRLNADGVLEANSNPALTAVTIHEGAPDGPTVDEFEKGGTYFFVPRLDERSLQSYGSLKADLSGIDVTDPESLQALGVDELLSRFVKTERCEVPLYNWYVSSGKLRREITLDESVITRVYDERGIACPPVEGDVRAPEAEFTAPGGEEGGDAGDALPDDGIVHGWVVLRDGRGGTAVRSFDVPMAD